MKRKKFLKTTGAFVAGSMMVPLVSCEDKPTEVRKNWAGNYQYKAKNLLEPKTTEELQGLVRKLSSQKALGSKHCFNNIADSPENQISTKHFNKVLGIDEEAMTVTVESGARYGEFAPELHQKGFALHNLASLPHISVAGAAATATHGSGVGNGNLASAVKGLELVDGNGQLVKLKEGDPDFYGAVVGLGALGIVTKVTLAIEKTFEVRQDVFQDLPLASLQKDFEAIMSAGYSVSLFTDWQNQVISQVWIKRRMDEEITDACVEFYGATAATNNLHPITRLSAENCTEQMGKPGPWYDRLPHFKMGFTPSSGEELQSEFFVPMENAVDAILALEKKRDLIYPQLMITEIRTIAADELWMSTAYRQPSVAIHFTWKQNPEEVGKLLPMIEAELSPFGVRPHWGKLFTVAPETLHARYPKYQAFLNLVKKYDPEGKFRNEYLDLNVYQA
jgi:alditol oxidase